VTTPTVIIRPGAAEDLEEIEEYLAANASPEVAADLLEAATKAFRLLASQPMMGRALLPPRPRLEDVRIWPLPIHRGYIVFYKPITTARGVEILHIFCGARDIQRLIDEEF
jgi:plasmid stabilization system protein ParE